jgi:hypothetical protein
MTRELTPPSMETGSGPSTARVLPERDLPEVQRFFEEDEEGELSDGEDEED